MKHIKSILSLAILLFGSNLIWAQSASTSLLEISPDGKMALFAVEASAPKAADATQAAVKSLFITLLDEGIEGFLQGEKLMQNPNAKWKENFLKDKNPPYMTYVKGIQTEGEPTRTTVGDYKATVLVRVNVEFLFRQLKAYGIMNK